MCSILTHQHQKPFPHDTDPPQDLVFATVQGGTICSLSMWTFTYSFSDSVCGTSRIIFFFYHNIFSTVCYMIPEPYRFVASFNDVRHDLPHYIFHSYPLLLPSSTGANVWCTSSCYFHVNVWSIYFPHLTEVSTEQTMSDQKLCQICLSMF